MYLLTGRPLSPTSVARVIGWPHDYLAAEEPYAPLFGTKPDDFRQRNVENEIAGEFANNVPG